jgi:hypothetical protein
LEPDIAGIWMPIQWTVSLAITASVVRPTLLYINAGATKVPAKGHKWPSLRLVHNPSERFQPSWNDNHLGKRFKTHYTSSTQDDFLAAQNLLFYSNGNIPLITL